MRLIPFLFLFSIILLLTVPATALSPVQITKITAVKTTIPLYDFGQKSPVTTTTTKADCGGWDYPQGFLTIESEPSGANITIVIHSVQGTIPMDLKKRTPLATPFFAYCEGFDYSIILNKDGYKLYTSDPIVLQPGDSGQIHAVLVPITTTTVPTTPAFAASSVTTAAVHQSLPQGTVPGTFLIPSAPVNQATQPSQSPVPGTGSLSVATNPPKAAIEIDGIPAGASPATVPGLAAGTHNLTITMPGYAALITQINIVGGQTMEYSTTLIPATVPTRKQTPGFEAAVAGAALAGIVLLKRKA